MRLSNSIPAQRSLATEAEVDIQWSAFSELPEPYLLFDPYDSRKRDRHPLNGLLAHGPFSSANLGAVPTTIRVATVSPHEQGGVLDRLISELTRRQRPQERPKYLPEYPGFEQAFRRRLAASPPACRIELQADLDGRVATSAAPHLVLAEALQNALARLRLSRADWDVALIYLPERWRRGYVGGAGDDFDLHDFLKATSAAQAMPTQIVNEAKAIAYKCRASVGWRLGLALYVKSGGVPWKMEPVHPGSVFIGVSYAVRSERGVPRFVTCCSQIFDAEGTGLEFLVYGADASATTIHADNPYLRREQMRSVMARSLDLFLRRHAGEMPSRIVVHKNTEFKREEREGCFEALSRVDNLELVQVQDSGWRGTRVVGPRSAGASARPDAYPAMRGTLVTLDDYDALVWTQGNAPTVAGGEPWFQEGKGIPRPLLLRRFAGHCDASLLGQEVLALTKMNWNNDALYDTYPATLGFAHRLAEIVKRMPRLDPRPYPLRLFM